MPPYEAKGVGASYPAGQRRWRIDVPMGLVRIDGDAFEVVSQLPAKGAVPGMRWAAAGLERAAALRGPLRRSGVVVVGEGGASAYVFCGEEAAHEILSVLAQLGVRVDDEPVRLSWWRTVRG